MDEYKYNRSVLKSKRQLFKGYCFNFEGLSEECQQSFEYIIKDLGGKVSNASKYILVEKAYFQKIENVNHKEFYYLKFILDCIESHVLKDIKLYRCSKISTKNCNKNEENSPLLLQRKLKANCNSSSEKRKKYSYNYDTEDSFSDETIKIKSKPKSSDSSEDDFHFVSVKSEPLSSDESNNCETDDESSIRKKIKMDKKDDSPPSSIPDNSTKMKIEDRPDLKWLFEVDPSDLCSENTCTFAPVDHQSHSYAGRIISDEEKKIILTYLIKNDQISKAKGCKIWENMILNGYLTHRSAETLRNCLRRVILPNICKYKLPVDILDQFLKLEEKKSRGIKIW